ncbi:MAG: hypothetical protein WCS03_19355, partial [Bacteroidota bacterium]
MSVYIPINIPIFNKTFDIWNTSLSTQEIINEYQRFLDKAKQVNPQYEFINELIQYAYPQNYVYDDIDEDVFSSHEKEIEQDNLTHGLDKKLVRTYSDGIDVNPVYAVNGDEVRDSGFIEWVEGGNHWVDADLPKSEQKYAK